MQKLKSLNWSGAVCVIKCCLIGIVVTLVGIVAFAVVLKFADLSTKVIGYVNDVIKALSIFVMVLLLKKCSGEKLLLKSIFGGVAYAVLSFVIFSILNGSFGLNLSVLYDLLFAVIVAVIASVIINLLNKRNA